MRKSVVLALLALWVAMGMAVVGTMAQEKQEKKAKDRWHGIIVRSNKDNSTLTVRKGNVEKTVQYDDSTVWTHLNKNAQMSDVMKDGADVICLGSYDDKGVLHATRIDLRRE